MRGKGEAKMAEFRRQRDDMRESQTDRRRKCSSDAMFDRRDAAQSVTHLDALALSLPVDRAGDRANSTPHIHHPWGMH